MPEQEYKFSEEITVDSRYGLLLENHPTFKKSMEDEDVKLNVVERNERSIRLQILAKNSINALRTKLNIEHDVMTKSFFTFEDKELANELSSNQVPDSIILIENKHSCKIFSVADEVLIFCLPNKHEMITGELEALSIKYESFVRVDYDFTKERMFDTLNQYLRLGDSLKDTPEVKNFANLVHSIYSGKDPYEGKNTKITARSSINWKSTFNDTAFIFVCASSGTGKTQLPFSLEIPLIYLIFNEKMIQKYNNAHGSAIESSIQDVYRPYLKLSSCFMQAVKRDVEYIMSLDLNQTIIAENSSDIILPDEATPLFLAGFLVAVYKRFLDLHKTFNNGKWILTQLRLESFRCAKMSVDAARMEIYELVKSHGLSTDHFPTIFFDECIKMENQLNAIRMYKYVRRTIRRLAIVSVFMGTNANISDFVTGETAVESRTAEPRVWCYIFFKLAPVSQVYLENEKAKIQEKMYRIMNGEIGRISKFSNFVGQVANLLITERPLICQYSLNFLLDDGTITSFSSLQDDSIDEKACLLQLLNFIFTHFTERKRKFHTFHPSTCASFSFANIQMLAPEYWKDQTPCFPNLEKNAGIHGHIANLFVDHNVLNSLNGLNFFGIVPAAHEYVYVGKYNKLEIGFKPEQTFGPFFKESVGQLMFVAPEGNEKLFIQLSPIKNETVERISISKAIRSIHRNPLINNLESARAYGWSIFESTVALAALSATFAPTFSGSTFDVWLSRFLFEIQVVDTRFIQMHTDQLFSKFSKIIIPFCAPSLKAEWNSEFGNYFINECQASIGTVDASLGTESRDFKIRHFGTNEAILSGECKHYSSGLRPKDLLEIILKLNSFSSSLNVIVCNKLSSEDSLKKLKSSIQKNAAITDEICIYYLKKESEIRPLHIYSGTNSAHLRLFLIINIAQ